MTLDQPYSQPVSVRFATANGTAASGSDYAPTNGLLMFPSNVTTATISGQVLFDNFGTIVLNGNQIGGTVTGYNSLTPFGTNANFFVAGLNTLSFILNNTGGPEAFQVAGLTVTAEPVAGTVPEPASWALMIAGFVMVGATMRRRVGTKTVAA